MHPFSDANGRTGRLLLNLMLQLRGLPFFVTFVETPADRSRHNAAFRQSGFVESERLAVESLTRLIYSRVAEAWREFDGETMKNLRHFASGYVTPLPILTSSSSTSSSSSSPSAEEKAATTNHTQGTKSAGMRKLDASIVDNAAKMKRAQLKASMCCICLGDEPTASLLCCGTAIHLSCMRTWQHKNRTCPVCRSEIDEPEHVSASVAAVEASDVDSTQDTEEEEEDYSDETIEEEEDMEPVSMECVRCHRLAARACTNKRCSGISSNQKIQLI